MPSARGRREVAGSKNPLFLKKKKQKTFVCFGGGVVLTRAMRVGLNLHTAVMWRDCAAMLILAVHPMAAHN